MVGRGQSSGRSRVLRPNVIVDVLQDIANLVGVEPEDFHHILKVLVLGYGPVSFYDGEQDVGIYSQLSGLLPAHGDARNFLGALIQGLLEQSHLLVVVQIGYPVQPMIFHVVTVDFTTGH